MIKTQERDYVRDPYSHALLNTNKEALQERRVRKDHAQRIANLENDMAEVKSLSQQILSLLQASKT